MVSDPGQIEEINELLGGVTPPPAPGQVLLMPEGIDPETLQDRSRFIVELCKRTGYRFCPRLHIELFGNTKGT